ncbi:hypothetical protein DRP04_06050 [Archaeoglobales archaeon]|mgnify:CR=1 FL=1|nr:MAG: hypothetical protein DRP04_06050 [Archaeoglobales archaeon]
MEQVKPPESEIELQGKIIDTVHDTSARVGVKKMLDEQGREFLAIVQTRLPLKNLINEDLTKANLSELDEAVVWGDLSICEFLTFIMQQDPNLDLTDAFYYFLNHAYLTIEISRGRKGFAVWMVKTRKQITETPQQFQPLPQRGGWLFWR